MFFKYIKLKFETFILKNTALISLTQNWKNYYYKFWDNLISNSNEVVDTPYLSPERYGKVKKYFKIFLY